MKGILQAAAWLAVATAVAAPALAQAPVPPGEVATAGSLAGVVEDGAGSPIPGATVRIEGLTNDVRRQLTTGPDGRFTAGALPAGTYRVTTELAGFAVVAAEAPVQVGVATSLRLVVGGPVPPGEPGGGAPAGPDDPVPAGDPPGDPPAAPAFEVTEGRFADDLDLHEAIEQRREGGWDLRGIVSRGALDSLFVWHRIGGVPAPCTVVVVPEALDGGRLARRIAQHPTRTFVGVHRLGPTAHLLVFRDGG